MQITFEKLTHMANTIQQIGNVSGSPKFTYGIVKNQTTILKILREFQKDIDKKHAVPVKYNEYTIELAKVQEKYIAKDDKNQPIFKTDENGFRRFTFENQDKEDAYNRECDKLEQTYAEQIKIFQDRLKAVERMKHEVIEFTPHLIELKYVPAMTVAQMDMLQDLFSEDKLKIIE